MADNQRWSPEEDTILLSLLEKLIKANLWEAIKADGRLVSRTSYGCSYRAMMLVSLGLGSLLDMRKWAGSG
jgi:hypothetical protein